MSHEQEARLGPTLRQQIEQTAANVDAAASEQLQAEPQAHAEARRLLLAALERIPPALEAPSGAPGSPERDQGEGDSAMPRPDTSGPQTQTSQRPWWRRLIGG